METTNNIDYLVSGAPTIESLVAHAPLQAVAPETLNFITQLSSRLLRSSYARKYPEIVALGFWLREKHIVQLVSRFTNTNNEGWHKPLGCVVHYTPNNVDTMFVYSWICSLIMGNVNIVRLGSTASEVRDVILHELDELFSLPAHEQIAIRNMFLQFDKSSDLNFRLSELADARVIWGGDESILAIKKLPAKPRCRDISFADRYSVALINGDAIESENDINQLAELLWQDTKPFLQHACSSPKVVLWMGSTSEQSALANRINELATSTREGNAEGYAEHRANEHLVTCQLLQSQQLATPPLCNESICMLPVSEVNEKMLAEHPGEGMFFLLSVSSIEDITELLADRLQTLTYWGVEKPALLKLLASPSIIGVDRCVPVGQALSFSPDWDGYRLFSTLSRYVYLG
ncbi:hypothetical protein OCL06_10325 [Alteromonas sp. ASW11-19]|uniref:Long-chain-fatty-acyl-CoA reductase n=2 Tax=Alteromonas salexigens TaxID=2982530 RepID=A0ABT2VRZ3_9ALTE|nr:hypothetical protein [Alteromonas salexigens]